MKHAQSKKLYKALTAAIKKHVATEQKVYDTFNERYYDEHFSKEHSAVLNAIVDAVSIMFTGQTWNYLNDNISSAVSYGVYGYFVPDKIFDGLVYKAVSYDDAKNEFDKCIKLLWRDVKIVEEE